MKKVIFTVLLGDYKLNEPEYKNPDWEHICFSDREIKSESWKVVVIDCKNIDSRKKSREIKILFHKYIECDVCIYVDAKFKIKTDLNKFLEMNLSEEYDLCVMKHNKRTCLYEEAKFCYLMKKENKDILVEQMEHYKNNNMPENFGLFAPGIMIRRNNEKVRQFMEMWFNQVKKFSYRDIVSFSYIFFKYPINLNIISFKETYNLFR